MSEDDQWWKLIREGAPLPEAPTWFVARTMARLRTEKSRSPVWWQVRRWVWAGSCALLLLSALTTWNVYLSRKHEQQITFAALDFLAEQDKSHDQDGSWLTSY